MTLSLFWVATIAVGAYHLGRNSAFNDVAGAGGPNYTGQGVKVAGLGSALTPGKAIADVIEPTSPAVDAINLAGNSAWIP